MRSRARTGYRSALIAAVTVLLLTPTSLLRQGEAMQEGVTRSVTLAVARPVSAVSRALHLERTASSMLAGLHIGDGADAGTGTPLLLRKDLSLPPPVPPQSLRAPASGGRATALGVHGGSGGVDPRLPIRCACWSPATRWSATSDRSSPTRWPAPGSWTRRSTCTTAPA